MRTTLFTLLFCISLQSCVGCNGRANNSISQNGTIQETLLSPGIDATRADVFDNTVAIRTLEEFYKAYLTEALTISEDNHYLRMEQIREKYVTADLLDKIYNVEMVEFDPFVDAQDFFEDWLETLKIGVTDSEKHLFAVTLERYNTFIPSDAKNEITLLVVKEDDGYKIGDIITQEGRVYQVSESESTDEFTGSNGSVNRGRYADNSGAIIVEIRRDSLYRIFEKGHLLYEGKYNTSLDENTLYIEMRDISAMYHSDTLFIQNSGNAMNPYQHFKSSDDKYIYLINSELE